MADRVCAVAAVAPVTPNAARNGADGAVVAGALFAHTAKAAHRAVWNAAADDGRLAEQYPAHADRDAGPSIWVRHCHARMPFTGPHKRFADAAASSGVPVRAHLELGLVHQYYGEIALAQVR